MTHMIGSGEAGKPWLSNPQPQPVFGATAEDIRDVAILNVSTELR